MLETVTRETLRQTMNFNGAYNKTFGDNSDIPDLQEKGVLALCSILEKRACAYLADEVGMGKTYQALGVVAMLLREKPNARILIIAPGKNVQLNWYRELQRFCDNNLIMPMPMDANCYEGPTDFVIDEICHRAPQIPILRLTSFSSTASNVIRLVGGQKKENNKYDLDELIAGANLMKSTEPPLVRKAYAEKKIEAQAANAFCGIAFNRMVRKFDLVVVDEAQNIRNCNQSTTFLNAFLGLGHEEPGYHPELPLKQLPRRKRLAPKALLLSATPAHRSKENIRQQMQYFTNNEDSLPAEINREYLEKFMIRRLRTYLGKTKYDCRQNFGEDVDSNLSVNQRLFLALVQTKLEQAQLKDNATYKIGFLETFESYQPTEADPDKNYQEGAGGKPEFENGNDPQARGAAPDKEILRNLAESFEKSMYPTNMKYPPHPKLSFMENAIPPTPPFGVDCRNAPNKTLIFVRRLASVSELTLRLNQAYEQTVIDAWAKFLPRGEVRDLPTLQSYFERLYNKSNRAEEQPDGEEGKEEETDSETDTGLRGWLASGSSTEPNRQSAVSRFKRTLIANGSNSFFFDENYLRTVINLDSEEAFHRFVSELVDDEFIRTVSEYISADQERFFRKKGDKRRKAIQKSSFLALNCYVALSKLAESGAVSEKLPQQIARFYCLPTERVPAATIPARSKEKVVSSLTQQSLWNMLIASKSPGKPEFPSLTEAFQERELCKIAMGKYLRGSEAILELMYRCCTAGSRQKAMEQYVELHLLAENNASAQRIWQMTANYHLVCDQLMDPNSLRNLNCETKFAVMNDQGWVIGATGSDDNQAKISRFNTPFYPDVVVCTDVFKEGINLHLFCDRVYHYGLAWSPGDLEQRIGRVDRYFSKTHRAILQGEAAKVQVHYPYMGKTIDELQLKRVLQFKVSIDPLLDQNGLGGKELNLTCPEYQSVQTLLEKTPEDKLRSRAPFSGERFWGEKLGGK